MSKTQIFTVHVQFGDCDPAGIVFFPHFSRWMDAASHHFFRACGLPHWRDMAQLPNVIGAPLLEIHNKFYIPATDGDTLQVHTGIDEWKGKVFVQHHRVFRGDTLLCEGWETRALCVKDPDTGRLKAVPVPDFILQACA